MEKIELEELANIVLKLENFIGRMENKYLNKKKAIIIQFPRKEKDNLVEDLSIKKGESIDMYKKEFGKGSYFIRTITVKDKNYKYHCFKFYYKNVQYACTDKTITGLLSKVKNLRKKLKNNIEIKKAKKSLLFVEWIEEYNNLFKQNNDISTKQQKSNYIKKIKDYFDKTTLNEIDVIQIQKFLNIWHGKQNTQRKLFDIMNSALNKAYALRKINFNPMLALDRPSSSTSRKEPFLFWEQNAIINDDLLSDKDKNIFIFLCCTGVRISELIALTKEDFLQELKQISLTKRFDINKFVIKSGLKNGESKRYVPYNDRLFEICNIELFIGKINYKMFRQNLSACMKRNNIVNKTIHSCRHTFISVGHFVGIDELKLQKWAGHKTLAMTKDIYTSLLDDGNNIISQYIELLRNRR